MKIKDLLDKTDIIVCIDNGAWLHNWIDLEDSYLFTETLEKGGFIDYEVSYHDMHNATITDDNRLAVHDKISGEVIYIAFAKVEDVNLGEVFIEGSSCYKN